MFAMIIMATAISAKLQVAPDLDARLAKWKRVEMPFTTEGFTAREKRLVTELVAACRDLENIYWRQSDPADIELYQSLAKSTFPRKK